LASTVTSFSFESFVIGRICEGTLLDIDGLAHLTVGDADGSLSFELTADSHTISFTADGLVFVDGRQVWGTSYVVSSYVVIRGGFSVMEVEVSIDSKIVLFQFNLDTLDVAVITTPSVADDNHGLCGQSDRLVLSNDAVAPDASALVSDYSNCPIILDPPCEGVSDSVAYRARRYCFAIANPTGVYADCHSTIDPQPFVDACMRAQCDFDQRTGGCTRIARYEQLCKLQGISVGSVLDECGVCYGDGTSCLSDMATCAASSSGSVRRFDGYFTSSGTVCESALVANVQNPHLFSVTRQAVGTSSRFGIRWYSHAITISETDAINVDGEPLTGQLVGIVLNYGFTLHGTSDGIVVEIPSAGISLRIVAGDVTISVEKAALTGALDGACVSDTYLQHKVWDNVQLFEDACAVSVPPPPPPPCDGASTSVLADAHEYCAVLTQSGGEYASCLNYVDENGFYEECKQAFCRGGATGACGVISDMETECSRHVSTVDSIIDSCGDCYGDDSACVDDKATCTITGSSLIQSFTATYLYGGAGAYVAAQDCLYDSWSVILARCSDSTRVVVRYLSTSVEILPRDWSVTSQYHGQRLDWALASFLNVPRAYIESLVGNYGVLINGALATIDRRVATEDVITLVHGRVSTAGLTYTSFPASTPSGMTITSLNGVVTVSCPGVDVRFDGEDRLQVIVDSTRYTDVCGLCGSTTQLVSTDDSPVDPATADLWAFGNSWFVNETCAAISEPPPEPQLCDGDDTRLFHAQQYCAALLSQSGPYAACHNVVVPINFFESCVEAHCSSSTTSACSVIAEYETQCAQNSVTDVQTVRDECGVCHGDGSSCAKSSLQCTIYGPHYVGMLNQQFDFHGQCSYVILSDCELNEFTVYGHRTPETTVYNEIVADFAGVGRVDILPYSVKWNEIELTQFPVLLSGGAYVERTYDSIIITYQRIGLVLSFNQVTRDISVSVQVEFANRICGLCTLDVTDPSTLGDAASNQLVDSCAAGNCTVEQAALSWHASDIDTVVGADSCNPRVPVVESPCAQNLTLHNEAKTFCAALVSTAGGYSGCHDLVSPSAYYEACIADYCSVDAVRACTSYDAYEQRCRFSSSEPVSMSSVIDECGVCFGNGESCQLIYDIASVFGDPHYVTLDRSLYSFEGQCDYVFAKDCINNDFEVQVRNRNSSALGIHTYAVGIGAPDIEPIELFASGEVLVGGALQEDLPIMLRDGTTLARTAQGTIHVSLKRSRVLIDFTENAILNVFIPNQYAGQICGLAGNYDNVTRNDIVINGKNVTSYKFAQSWAVVNVTDAPSTLFSSQEGVCYHPPEPPQPPNACDDADPAVIEQGEARCAVIIDPTGPFQDCHKVLDPNPFYQACLQDMCYPAHALSAIRQYELLCKDRGEPSEPPIVDECGVPFGDGSSCEPVVATCTAYGNGHYQTLDGLDYSFAGTCPYTFVEDCSSGSFAVQTRLSHPDDSDEYHVAVRTTGGIDIDIVDSRVIIDSRVMTDAAFTLTDGTVVSQSFIGIVVELTNNVRVEVPQPAIVRVKVPTSFYSQVCGLCGDYTGTAADDLKLSTGETYGVVSVPRVYAFALSWAVPEGSQISSSFPVTCVDSREPPPNPCNLNPSILPEAERACGAVVDYAGLYAECLANYDASALYDACVRDYCRGDRTTELELESNICSVSLLTLESLCWNLGYTNDPVVDRCGVCMGDGSTCASQYATCGAYGYNRYFTISGDVFSFPAPCDFVLARDTLNYFEVQVRSRCTTSDCYATRVAAVALRLGYSS
jgi:hypothetical protein